MDSDAEELGHVHAAVRKIVWAIGGKRETDQQRGFRVTEMDTLPRALKRNHTSLRWQRYSQSESRQRARVYPRPQLPPRETAIERASVEYKKSLV
jgi:hypothetical protein